MNNKELNELAFELAIKSLDSKKKENKGLIITLVSTIALLLIDFSMITYMNCKRVDKVINLVEKGQVEVVDIDYGTGEFSGNATIGDNNTYGKN